MPRNLAMEKISIVQPGDFKKTAVKQ